ncbi:VOC family protein [Methylococcus sp. EFPC2]|uniref:VOC family protein n=1 Tax=Methylococcus sp. EFPC2 TaxID=2812648 RepID=UPI0019689764|nr:VOC family protein [Methylococcus sp. EFPC2]QSA96504.1 hypothetical protein JWZ97_14950 [Methylococcus sp. EFPC2]
MTVIALDHVQLAMPAHGEPAARGFYAGMLGLREIPKPEPLQARGGLWFACGSLQLHLGVDPSFRAAGKAHPAFVVRDLHRLIETLRSAGYTVLEDAELPGVERAFTADPFGAVRTHPSHRPT